MVEALTAHSNVALLAEQRVVSKPCKAVVAEERYYGALKTALWGSGVEAAAGTQAVIEAALMPAIG